MQKLAEEALLQPAGLKVMVGDSKRFASAFATIRREFPYHLQFVTALPNGPFEVILFRRGSRNAKGIRNSTGEKDPEPL